MAQLGKIYIAPGGAQLIVTKGGPGVLSDGDVALIRQDSGERFPDGTPAGTHQLQLGKRYKSVDGEVEVLINKAGPGALRHSGTPMELKDVKPLPSSD